MTLLYKGRAKCAREQAQQIAIKCPGNSQVSMCSRCTVALAYLLSLSQDGIIILILIEICYYDHQTKVASSRMAMESRSPII